MLSTKNLGGSAQHQSTDALVALRTFQKNFKLFVTPSGHCADSHGPTPPGGLDITVNLDRPMPCKCGAYVVLVRSDSVESSHQSGRVARSCLMVDLMVGTKKAPKRLI